MNLLKYIFNFFHTLVKTIFFINGFFNGYNMCLNIMIYGQNYDKLIVNNEIVTKMYP